jgi:hypothetical protein
MNIDTTGHPVLDVLAILLFMGSLALPGAMGAVIWYAVKVWFATKIVKKAWLGK